MLARFYSKEGFTGSVNVVEVILQARDVVFVKATSDGDLDGSYYCMFSGFLIQNLWLDCPFDSMKVFFTQDVASVMLKIKLWKKWFCVCFCFLLSLTVKNVFGIWNNCFVIVSKKV